jgi:hypothetical protein
VEETAVEGLEDLVEIVVVAGGCRDTFAATGLPDMLSLLGDGLGGDVAAVAVGVNAGDGLFVELGEEDVGDGVVDSLRCGLEQVGETDVKAAFAKANCGVEGGEAAEADVEGRNGRAGTEFSVLVLEDGDEGGGRRSFFCARLFRFGWLKCRCGIFVEESRGWCRARRKELQELTQG